MLPGAQTEAKHRSRREDFEEHACTWKCSKRAVSQQKCLRLVFKLRNTERYNHIGIISQKGCFIQDMDTCQQACQISFFVSFSFDKFPT